MHDISILNNIYNRTWRNTRLWCSWWVSGHVIKRDAVMWIPAPMPTAHRRTPKLGSLILITPTINTLNLPLIPTPAYPAHMIVRCAPALPLVIPARNRTTWTMMENAHCAGISAMPAQWLTPSPSALSAKMGPTWTPAPSPASHALWGLKPVPMPSPYLNAKAGTWSQATPCIVQPVPTTASPVRSQTHTVLSVKQGTMWVQAHAFSAQWIIVMHVLALPVLCTAPTVPRAIMLWLEPVQHVRIIVWSVFLVSVQHVILGIMWIAGVARRCPPPSPTAKPTLQGGYAQAVLMGTISTPHASLVVFCAHSVMACTLVLAPPVPLSPLSTIRCALSMLSPIKAPIANMLPFLQISHLWMVALSSAPTYIWAPVYLSSSVT